MAKLALLIGVSEYKNGIDSILSSERDVLEIERVLNYPDIGGFDDVKTYVNPDLQDIKERIESFFSKCKRDDLLLFYFSGHGILDSDGLLCLATSVTRKENLMSTTISSDFLHSLMAKSPSKQQAIILDCCFSGAFGEKMTARSDAAVLTSSGLVEYSNTGENLSLYTSFIVEGIETGAADLDNDGVISLDELHDYVKQKVQTISAEMKPEIHAIKGGYKIVLVKAPQIKPYLDWGDSYDVNTFYGRTKEFSTLADWILKEKCRLVLLLGMGGIGKSALAVKAAQKLEGKFKYVIWRSLKNAPPLLELLVELIKFLSNQKVTSLPSDIDRCIAILIDDYLKKSNCLIVLDNAETILKEGDQTGCYREGYENYGDLLKRVGELSHQSTLVLTSRETPKDVISLLGKKQLVRVLRVNGLEDSDSKEILKEEGFSEIEDQCTELVNRYEGNPLALRIVATTIQELFDGNIDAFLGQGTIAFDGIRDLLDEQLERISDLEKEVMYWLAIEREPIPISRLQDDIVFPITPAKLLESLNSLSRRCLIEKGSGLFSLQNVITEYIYDRLIEEVSEEITSENLNFFESHSLIMATTKDYVRETQVRLILQPLIDRLFSNLGNKKDIEYQLKHLLLKLKEKKTTRGGYVCGNVLNILCQLNIDLSGYDLSSLKIWQAYLKGKDLHNVNLAYCDVSKSIFTQTFGSVLSVAFSPDGEFLATSDANCEIRVWRIADSQQTLICKGHTDWVLSVVFSPDGHFLASCSEDETIKIWDIHSGDCIQTLIGHTSWVLSLAFSPDGRTIASSSEDKTIMLWNLSNGYCVQTLHGHNSAIPSVAFSPDGHSLASGSGDQTIKIWDVTNGICIKTLFGHTGSLWSVNFSSNGQMLASGGEDRTIKIWDISNGACIQNLIGHTRRVRCIDFHQDGYIIASGSIDQTIKIWNTSNGACIQTLLGHTDMVRSVAFSPNGKTLASGSEDQTIRIWDFCNAKSITTLQGYTNKIWSVAFSPDGKTLASGSEDQTIRIWDVHSGSCIQTLHGHTSRIRSLVFSPDGQILASGSGDQTIRIWNIRNGECLKILRGHTSWVISVSFSSDGQTLASCGSEDQTVRIWDVRTCICTHILKDHTNRIWSVAFSPDGQSLASGSEDQTVRIWDVQTGTCIQILQGCDSRIWSIAFSPDGQTLSSGSEDQTVRIWDVQTSTCIQILQGHTNRVWSVASSPDGKTLASGSEDQTVRIWDVQTGTCIQILQEHTNRVWSVAFSPDGKTLATGGEDEKIIIWDLELNQPKELRATKPYEGMNITDITGLTDVQKSTLISLGALQ